MKKDSKREVLRTHYLGLLRRVATWIGLGALVVSVMAPTGTFAAGQLTSRSTTLGSSAASASTSYVFTFTPASTYTVKAIKLEVCTSPLETTGCSASNSSSLSSAAFNTAGSSGSFSAWVEGTGSGGHAPAKTATAFYIDNSSGFATSTGTPLTVKLTGVVNPNVTNTEFYTRITTYNVQDASSGEQDFGGEAVSTSTSMTVAANVQESLTFCVGTTSAPANCGAESGSTVNIGTGADNVLSSSSPSGAISTMIADTNATSGYSITYFAGNLSSTSDTIGAIGSTPTSFPGAGTAAFGINLRANTSPSITNSANVTGSGSGSVATNYNTVNQFAFAPSAATQVASASGPTVSNTYTVSYAAQAGTTTKPGAFSTTFNYVCTGTF